MASHHRGRIPSYLATAAALLLAFLLPPLAASQWQNCGQNSNFTENSTYQANIQALSTTLPKNASSAWTLFAFASVGTVPDIVHALALCRGDANASACGACVSNGFKDAQQLCPYSKVAAVYYDLCYLGFSNQNILSATDGDNNALILLNDNNVTVPAVKVFDAAVGVLMNATADYAAADSSRRFGAGEEGFETIDKEKPKIYGLAQCRPDMSPADCRSCLADIITYIPRYLTGSQGARVLRLQCNFRYEQFPFFTGPSLLQLPAPSLGAAPAPAPANVTRPPVGGGDIPGSKRGGTKVLLIALTSAAAALLFPCVYVLIWYMTGKRNWFLLWKKNSSSTERHYEAMIALYGPLAPKRYMYSEVIKITSSRNKKLGQGGYGVVFEGKLHDGRLVAVKLLHDCKGNGEEFVNEVMSIGRTSHVNIVSLFGFCLEGSKRVLIYEYMCNGSLDRYIYSENPKEI